MRNTNIGIVQYLLFLLVSCNSHGAVDEDIQYTHLRDCKERIENVNAAFSELVCPKIGAYDVIIKKQSPQFITIVLNADHHEIASNFVLLTNELPIEYGKTIEWHLKNKSPKYLVFRLAWGTEAKPFEMVERLVINLVSKDKICPIAMVNTKTVKNANQKIRDLLETELSTISSCPTSIQSY
ncbi:MAG: hypothetical protein HY080_05395 [Gammaproteobacteria bacterium]|nr:hypothetical protein [Gammaproteobacteria bacterium]